MEDEQRLKIQAAQSLSYDMDGALSFAPTLTTSLRIAGQLGGYNCEHMELHLRPAILNAMNGSILRLDGDFYTEPAILQTLCIHMVYVKYI